MTEMSRACDSSDFDGNSILVGSDDIGYIDYVLICGFKIINFSSEGKSFDFISLMGNNMIPTAVAIGKKYTNFSFDLYNFFANEIIAEGTFLNYTDDSVDHVIKCGEGAFMRLNAINFIFFPRMEKLKKMMRSKILESSGRIRRLS